MDQLSREQVEQHCKTITMVHLSLSAHRAVQELAYNDALLRQRLAELEQSRDEWKRGWYALDHDMKAQLTAAQAEVERLKGGVDRIDEIGAHVNAQCENGCGTKMRQLLLDALTPERLKGER